MDNRFAPNDRLGRVEICRETHSRGRQNRSVSGIHGPHARTGTRAHGSTCLRARLCTLARSYTCSLTRWRQGRRQRRPVTTQTCQGARVGGVERAVHESDCCHTPLLSRRAEGPAEGPARSRGGVTWRQPGVTEVTLHNSQCAAWSSVRRKRALR